MGDQLRERGGEEGETSRLDEGKKTKRKRKRRSGGRGRERECARDGQRATGRAVMHRNTRINYDVITRLAIAIAVVVGQENRRGGWIESPEYRPLLRPVEEEKIVWQVAGLHPTRTRSRGVEPVSKCRGNELARWNIGNDEAAR